VKEHYTNIRANVWFHGLDARSRGRVMVSAELPLLYPLGRSKDLPRSATRTRRRAAHPQPTTAPAGSRSNPFSTRSPSTATGPNIAQLVGADGLQF